MIEGMVNSRIEAVVSVPLEAADGQFREVDFVIDTGFNGYMTLTPALALELGLEVYELIPMELADGSRTFIPSYYVIVIWDGDRQPVSAGALGDFPTIGMSLLEGYDLIIQVRDGGRILIQAGA